MATRMNLTHHNRWSSATTCMISLYSSDTACNMLWYLKMVGSSEKKVLKMVMNWIIKMVSQMGFKNNARHSIYPRWSIMEDQWEDAHPGHRGLCSSAASAPACVRGRPSPPAAAPVGLRGSETGWCAGPPSAGGTRSTHGKKHHHIRAVRFQPQGDGDNVTLKLERRLNIPKCLIYLIIFGIVWKSCTNNKVQVTYNVSHIKLCSTLHPFGN